MIIYNINTFVKEHTFLFGVLMFTQIICILMLLISYGVFRDSWYKEQGEVEHEKSICFILSDVDYFDSYGLVEDGISIEVSRVNKFLDKLENSQLRSKIEYVRTIALGHFDDYMIQHNGVMSPYCRIYSCFGFEGKHKYINVAPNSSYDFKLKTNFTDKQLNNREKVCLSGINMAFYTQKQVLINEEMYEIIGVDSTGACDVRIPYHSLSDDMLISDMEINFKSMYTQAQFDELITVFTESFPEITDIPEIKAFSIDEKKSSKTIMLLAVVVALFSSFSLSIIYQYLLDKRRKMTAVFRICGSTLKDVVIIYYKEAIVLLLFASAFGSLVFEIVAKQLLAIHYQWFPIIYENKGYYWIVVIFDIIVMLSVLPAIIKSCKKMPKEVLYGD